MTDSQQLRESMWDFVYGLLSEEENQALIARIKSDPHAARLYSEVRLQADLIGEASLVEDSSLVLNAQTAERPNVARLAKAPACSAGAVSSRRGVSHRTGTWLAGIGATALAALLAVGLVLPQLGEPKLTSAFIAADVTGPRSLQAGLTNKIAVKTYLVSARGEPAGETSAAVDLRLVDRTDQERFRTSVLTDDGGQATIEIPGDVLEPGVRLELATSPSKPPFADVLTTEQLSVSESKPNATLAAVLPVEPEPRMVYVLQSEPTTEATKAVPYAVWNFAAFSARPGSEDGPQSVVTENLARSRLEPQAGGKAEGLAYGLDKSALGRTLADREAAPVIAAGEPVTVSVPQQLTGKNVAIAAVNRGVTVATASSPDSNAKKPGDAKVALDVPPEADGLIELEFYDRSSSDTGPAAREYVYRQPSRKLQIELPTVQQRLTPGQQVELQVRVTDESGQPVANTRLGVRVWNEQLLKQTPQQLVLLADAVHGATETVSLNGVREGQQRAQAGELATSNRFARRQNESLRAAAVPAEALAEKSAEGERLAGLRRLGEDTALAAAEPIELASNRDWVAAAVRDAATSAESDRQRTIERIGGAAVFGGIALLVLLGILALLHMAANIRVMVPALVAAVASLLIGLAWIGWLPQRQFGQIAMAPAAATQSAPPSDDAALAVRESPNSGYFANQPARDSAGAMPTAPAPKNAPAPAAPALTAGGAPAAVEERKDADAPPPQLSAARAQAAPGSAGAFGGRGLPQPAGPTATSDLQLKATAGAAAKELRDERADAKSQVVAAPASLYFNPELMTDAAGRATVRFVMPPVDSEYRVLIDAIGNGRIGSRQEIIAAGDPAKSK